MSPSSAQFLDVNRNDNNAISSTTNINVGTTGLRQNNIQYELVTQMALLIYLGEYTHARHLWERNSGRFNANNNGSNDDYVQLEQLWSAVKYCCLWSTGGVYSLTSSSISSKSSVEANNNNDKDEDGSTSRSTTDLPFSTIALRALDVCVSRQMEPLSTYATELIGVFRSRVNRGMHSFFERLDCAEFLLRMNFNIDDAHHGATTDRGNDVATWTAYGWKKDEGGYLISSDVDDIVVNDIASDMAMELDKGGMTPVRKDEVDRISKLTEIVMFLESKMNV
jgi:hypothetical protein